MAHAGRLVAAALAIGLAACGVRDGGGADAGDTRRPFSFALLADTHINGDAWRAQRLAALVQWMNREAPARHIELVLVLGDIGWRGHAEAAATLLDGLQMPWAPLVGDNEIHSGGGEEDFSRAFGPRLERLAQAVSGFARAPSPVDNPQTGGRSWFVNYSFDYEGVHFAAVDWADRSGATDLEGERGHAQDFAGGTWPWLVADLARHADAPRESIILASHIPMHDSAMDEAAMALVRATIGPRADAVFANVAGHVHLDYELHVGDLYDVYVQRAAFATSPAVRVFDVVPVPGGFEYEQETVPVDL